ncbi:MAG: hypothetical protein MAG453_00887 [Calditrichaeota bacterium]|nr:hypothetical protein [Calditrichota bacterium]
MNRLAIVFVITLVVLIAVAPAQARVWELGGGGGIERRGGMWGADTYSYPFRPHVATFVTPHLTIGLNLQYNSEETENTSLLELHGGPRATYYFRKAGPGYPFAEGVITFGMLFKEAPGRGDYSDGQFMIEAGGGYMYLINQYLGLYGKAYFQQHFYDDYVLGWKNGNKLGVQVGVRLFIY